MDGSEQARGGPGGALGEVLARTAALIAPRQCPCGREDTWLCARCAELLQAPPIRVESGCDALLELTAARVRAEHCDGVPLPPGVDHTPVLPVLALGEYGGDLQALVLAWKNGGMLHLGQRIAPALAAAASGLAAQAGVSRPALVPVPSRRAARLRRGEDHTAELVRAMQRSGGGEALPLRAHPTTTQEGLGARQRRSRRIRLTGRAARRAGELARPVVVVDDVVTTGATLRGMHEALTAAGMEVVGAVVVAASRLPGGDGDRARRAEFRDAQ